MILFFYSMLFSTHEKGGENRGGGLGDRVERDNLFHFLSQFFYRIFVVVNELFVCFSLFHAMINCE